MHPSVRPSIPSFMMRRSAGGRQGQLVRECEVLRPGPTVVTSTTWRDLPSQLWRLYVFVKVQGGVCARERSITYACYGWGKDTMRGAARRRRRQRRSTAAAWAAACSRGERTLMGRKRPVDPDAAEEIRTNSLFQIPITVRYPRFVRVIIRIDRSSRSHRRQPPPSPPPPPRRHSTA